MKFSSCLIDDLFQKLNTNEHGLSSTQVSGRRKVYGYNEIPDVQKKTWYLILWNQFKSLLVMVLLLVALLSFFIGNPIDAWIILAVVVIQTVIGFTQEWRAESSTISLKKMLQPIAKTLRDGEVIPIPARELVPGDVFILEEGDQVPADGRLIEVKNLRTTEAALTGESLPESKVTDPLPAGTPLADQINMVRKGTFVASGYGKAVVTSIGMQTAIGQVAQTLLSVAKEKSHFQKKIDRLAYQMGIASILCASLFFLIGYFSLQLPWQELVLISIAAMVSIIPEGLPAIIVIVLTIGANRMTKKNAIIRELTATETLGAVTTIITDKTGTLTENALTARWIHLCGEPDIEVTGEGWFPVGNFIQENIVFEPATKSTLEMLLKIAAGSNNSTIRHNKEDNVYELLGDPTEGALRVLAKKGGIHTGPNRIDDLPFNSSDKFRASLVHEDGKRMLYVIGAPEKILLQSARLIVKHEVLPIAATDLDFLQEKITRWSEQSLRVIALAYKELDLEKECIASEDLNDFTFCGLVGMLDPPRAEVKEAMVQCRDAGVRVVMATGDHLSTAVAIARMVGIVEELKTSKTVALTEDQLLGLDAQEFDNAITTINVFARLTPAVKLKIASRLQELGQLIAMTGDGVNDAPALKKADVGIAMGIMGTDVARDSAKVVLADDNFSTIVNAIEEGRIVFKNARQATFYLITTNFAEITTLIVAILLGLPMPLTAVQILWLNLVTDGTCDIALATERGHGLVMNESPLRKDEKILNKSILPFLFVNVLIMACLSLIAFAWFLPQGLDQGRSAVFIVMSFTQLFNMYNMRSLEKSIFEIGLFSNIFVTLTFIVAGAVTVLIVQLEATSTLFGFAKINPIEFITLVAISSSVFWAIEAYKYFTRLRIKA